MAAGPTYTPIYTTTTNNSTTNNISLNSFGGYTDLIIVMTGAMTSAGFFYIDFNSTGGNTSLYSELRFLCYSAGLLSDINNNLGKLDSSVDTFTSKPGCARLHIPQYTNTNFGKVAYLFDASQNSYNLQTNYYNSTSAITSIELTTPSGVFFASDFEVTLYGLLGA